MSWSHPSPSPAVLTDVSLFAAASLHRTLSIQNLSQMEKPWENVTLNRCLFVAITILVLASGFQRLHGNHHSISVHPGTTLMLSVLTEAVRGQRATEEEEDVGLRVRRSGALRPRGQDLEVKTLSLMLHLRCSLLCLSFRSLPA